jgi:VIT1/CCC1 family predicted Fe2+/Mn2+ transporter
MTNRFAQPQLHAASLAGAFVFAALMIGAAVPVVPVA